MNRCDLCNKFRKWEDLKHWEEPYFCIISEDIEYKEHLECRLCEPKFFEEKM